MPIRSYVVNARYLVKRVNECESYLGILSGYCGQMAWVYDGH
jgi:hypothetical protein